MKNPYKRTDVFACNYQGHAAFNHRVSVYHVMRQKKCYPHGCLMFKWSCALKNKGKRCYRGLNYVGRLCEGCTHYTDEKIHYQPKIILSGAAFEEFQNELDDFDEWVNENENRDLEILCEISSIKPYFKKTMSGGKGQLRLDGYLLVMRHGYIGITEFDDYFYANISPNQQDRFRFAAGDTFEATGRMNLNRGRLLFNKVWSVTFEHRSSTPTWNNSKALVARASATEFYVQQEACIRCAHGALVDTVTYIDGQKQFKRSLYCLKGIKNPELCYISATEKIDLCAKQNN
ncbi:hypothetical protein EH223_06100 [candidate division KSB1 bacterium]|nr:hypothetical protein [candidate division KSB1 bacterium]RQW05011.1 MAG: hypothetical protein EH223_06100 [candidate division KSB1 bacterium]